MISYLVLNNKLPSNLAAYNNRYLSHGFCGSGFQARLHWAFCSGSPIRQRPRCWRRLRSSRGRGWKSTACTLSAGVSRIHILGGYWAGSWLGPPSVLALWSSGGQLTTSCFPQVGQERMKKGEDSLFVT